MTHQQTHTEAGFTLIEVMIALLVFTIGVLGLARLQFTAVNGNATANRITEAIAFCSDQIERIQSWDYDDSRLDDTNDSVSYTLESDGVTYTVDGSRTDPSGLFDAYWEVTADSPVTGSKTVDITVIWEWHGGQKTLALTTVKDS